MLCTWAPSAKNLHIGKGYLWAVTGVNEVKHTSDLSTWSSAITIGESMYEITDIIGYQGKLLVGKEDGVWEVDDEDIAIEYLLFREHAHPDNCVGWAVWSGMLFIPVQGTVWRWQGSQYKDIGPTDKKAGPTSEWPNRVSRMAPTAPYMLATTEPAVTGGWGGMLMYNGSGWHHVTLASKPDEESKVLFVTTEVGTDETRIWYGEGAKIAYIRFPTYTGNRYDWADADYDITGATFISSWWDGGVKDAKKFWNRLSVNADIPTGTAIEIYVAEDGENWTGVEDFRFLGSLQPSLMDDTGEYTVMFPDGMVAKSIQIIFMFHTLTSSASPRIKAFNVESLVRQPPAYVYSFRVLLASNLTKMNGETETSRSSNDMWEALQRAAAKNAPIIVSFPNKSIRGLISHLSESTEIYESTSREGENWETIANVSVIEAT